GPVDALRAPRQGRRDAAQVTAEDEPLHPGEAGEAEADAALAVPLPPPADDARHARLGVEPDVEVRRAERDEDALARLEIGELGPDEHPVRRDVDRLLGDEGEVALAHDVALQLDRLADLAAIVL